MKNLHTQLLSICFACLLPLPGALFAADQSSTDRAINLLNEVENYRQLLAQIETSTGPYGRDLFEPLSSLAQALFDAEIYSEAEEMIDRGMQVIRINDGLYNPQQLPLLQLSIEIDIRLGDFEAANDASDYLVEIYSNEYSDQPLALLQSLESVSDWHYSLMSQDEDTNQAKHLLRAHDLNLQMVAATALLEPQDLTVRNYYAYRQALSTYYFSSAIATGGRTGTNVLNETSTIYSTYTIENPARRFPREFEDKLNEGLTLVEQVTESYGETATEVIEAKVMASIYYADWRILYRDGMRVIGESSPLSRARSIYRQAKDDLISLGYEAQTVERYFSIPALLPVTEFTESFEKALALSLGVRTSAFETADPVADEGNAGLTRLPDFYAWSEAIYGVTMPATSESNLADELSDLYGDVRFRVDTSGKASRLSVLQHHPADKSQRIDLLREVQSLVFRPSMTNDRFRNSETVTMRYYYPLDYPYR